MFVSQKALTTQQSHVEGFAAQVAWVTKYGDTDLAENIAIRPTSQTIMYPAFAKWIHSHRDLPLKLNQWCNVVRWEFKHPTPFLRTREFLWQEGHTAHATYEGAMDQVMKILDFYAQVYEDLLAVPVIKGQKSELEKFAGGHTTTTIQTIIPANGRGIQCATSHCLGQNFSKMFEIQFQDQNQQMQFVWQNSWGLTTRTIGVMVMVHGDDKGMVLPPRAASIQVVIVPIFRKNQEKLVIQKAEEVFEEVKSLGVRVHLDDRANVTPGWKYNHWELMGVPLRMEIGPKNLENNTVRVVKRYNSDVVELQMADIGGVVQMLEDIQSDMLEKQREQLLSRVQQADNWDEFLRKLNELNFIVTPWCEKVECEKAVKLRSAEESKEDKQAVLTGAAKTLCLPFDQEPLSEGQKCFACEEQATRRAMWGRSY